MAGQRNGNEPSGMEVGSGMQDEAGEGVATGHSKPCGEFGALS